MGCHSSTYSLVCLFINVFFSLFNAFLLVMHCFHLSLIIALSLSLLIVPHAFCCFPISLKNPLAIYMAIDLVLCFPKKVVYISSLFSNWLLLSVFSMPYAALLCTFLTYKYHKKVIISLVVRFPLPYNTCWFFPVSYLVYKFEL